MDTEAIDDISEVYNKFRKFLKSSSLKEREKRTYYSNPLVMWLMICQRLNGARSMANLLEMTNDLPLKKLSGKRKVKKHKSNSTSGYAMARSRLSLEIVTKLIDELCEWMLEGIAVSERLYVVDGSTFELTNSKELSENYTPSTGGYYPMLRGLMCTEINSGITLRPEIGGLAGSKQAGEIKLFKQLIPRLPSGAMLMGDRNFGIHVVAMLSKKQGLNVILRLTDDRATKINGGPLPTRCDKEVTWYPSKNDLNAHPELQEGEGITGRLICKSGMDPKGNPVKLLIFTTTKLTVPQLIDIYKKRWRIEVDIRDIKKSMNMEFLRVKSEDMAIKELYLGICAYNLTRKIIFIAADKLGIDPRTIGFLRAKTVIEVNSTKLFSSHTKKKQRKVIRSLYEGIQRCKLPNRKRTNRHEPRALVRDKRSKYPTLKGNRNDYK